VLLDSIPSLVELGSAHSTKLPIFILELKLMNKKRVGMIFIGKQELQIRHHYHYLSWHFFKLENQIIDWFLQIYLFSRHQRMKIDTICSFRCIKMIWSLISVFSFNLNSLQFKYIPKRRSVQLHKKNILNTKSIYNGSFYWVSIEFLFLHVVVYFLF
jgi:hypothetical protein